ncbi:UDP-glucose 4-epimerase family protein [Burkholderia plantarii]|uniref:UDP-glucose 4-epimerase family protein n=1 Tax=Burkholderia plantarii TaxID=41899 RepID=UPI0018DE2306|nr:SDR family oxidoreductase [Burkholderia plantarii]MBI0326131.1 SDR family oxidoreductase [Burkholderia plantarii]
MSRILVTGANGFVGRAACRALLVGGHAVTGLVRRPGNCVDGVSERCFDGIDFDGLAGADLPEIDCVIHLAARVHVMNDRAADPDLAFRATNLTGTLRVAEAARCRGARRFVFVSSVKALAESDSGTPLSEDTPARPLDPYGRSKRDAELALLQWGKDSGIEVVIVRPPLVYGPGVRANFLRMLDAVARGVPLPLGSVRARRSLVYVDNLADALRCCATDPRATGCFHVADDDAPTVAGLLSMVGEALGRPARLLPFPVGLLRAIGRLTGRSAQVDRLAGSLQLDTRRIREELGWQPPSTTRQGLAATVDWYRSRHHRT